jgi:hypothetical protein
MWSLESEMTVRPDYVFLRMSCDIAYNRDQGFLLDNRFYLSSYWTIFGWSIWIEGGHFKKWFDFKIQKNLT